MGSGHCQTLLEQVPIALGERRYGSTPTRQGELDRPMFLYFRATYNT